MASMVRASGRDPGLQGDEDLREMLAAVEKLLEQIGEDVTREGLHQTPLRVSKALKFVSSGPSKSALDIIGSALFTESPTSIENLVGQGGGEGGMVFVRDIDMFSTCKGCMLPLLLQCHVAYIPGMCRVVGLSKLPRICMSFARRLQSPTEFATLVATSINESINPCGVAVLVECWHLGESPLLKRNGNGLRNEVVRDKGGFGWQQVVFKNRRTCGVVLGEFENLENGLWEEFLAFLGRGTSSCTLLPKQESPSCSSLEFCKSAGGYCTSDWAQTEERRRGSWDGMLLSAKNVVKAVLGPDEKPLEQTASGYVAQLMAATIGLAMSLDDLLEEISSSVERQEQVLSQHQLSTSLSCPVFPIEAPPLKLKDFKSLGFGSLCEHHLLPFFGDVHVGLSMSARQENRIQENHLQKVIFLYSRRPQVQERLTRQIAEAVATLFDKTCRKKGSQQNGFRLGMEDGSFGVIVVLKASHLCVATRGVEKAHPKTLTMATLGCYAENSRLRSRFLQSLPNSESKIGRLGPAS